MQTLVRRHSLDDVTAALRPAFAGHIDTDVSLSSLSRWRVGGTAKCIFRPASHADIATFVKYMHATQTPYGVIGSTTNLLFSEQGIQVPLLRIDDTYARVQFAGDTAICQSGVWVPGFARATATRGLAGLAHIVGIPGTLGGLVCMNGGSQRKGVGEHIVSVKSVTATGESRTYSQAQCNFSYRHSVFLDNKEVISEVTLQLEPGEPKAIKREMLQILRSRSKKFPRKLPNCGSVFVSDPSMYADYGPPGAVIERCGLKGTVQGGAQISPLHANFIVNRGGATAEDILSLIYLARSRVQEETGYGMKAEALYVEPDGSMVPAHIKANAVFA